MTRESPVDPESIEKRNFLSTAVYQVLLRVGWIFKTESVIIPAALDSIGGTGWVRGCLPMLNRIGQSLPPLLAWPLVSAARKQRSWLAATTLVMGLMFCLLSGIWISGLHESGRLAQVVFLAIYALFFVATGINQLTLSSLIGKLIRPNLRGRLMLVANTVGCLASVACAWFVLRHWLGEGDANFAAIFATSGCLFILAAGSSFLLHEPARKEEPKRGYRLQTIFGEVWQTCTEDRQFRLLAVISGLFGLSMTLMPHYQNLARIRLDLGFSDLVPWLIIQNIGVAIFSIPVGSIADRLGNRAALRIVLLFLLAAPVLALMFSNMPVYGRAGFMVVYFLLGLMPVTMRILSNYSLEFTSVEHQARYLTAQSIAMALPVIFASTTVGYMLDRFGFEPVFGTVIALMLLGWFLTFRLHEPRNEESSNENY